MPKRKYSYALKHISDHRFALLFMKSGHRQLRGTKRTDLHEGIYLVLKEFHDSGRSVAEIETDAPLNSAKVMFYRAMSLCPDICENVKIVTIGDRMFLLDESRWYDD